MGSDRGALVSATEDHRYFCRHDALAWIGRLAYLCYIASDMHSPR